MGFRRERVRVLSRNLFTDRLSTCIIIASCAIYFERNKSFSLFFPFDPDLEQGVKILEEGRTYHRCPRWVEDEREDACGYRWKGRKEGSKEEKRRERGRRAGESVGDSCRGVAGSISVDRRHKLFQWTRSSGSISLPLFLSFVPFMRFFLAGQSARFNRAEMFSGPAIFRGSLVLRPTAVSILR